jgi:pimeloyl-ACP methyl ester carboxylesterase
LAYEEKGISADRARFSLIAPHSFLSSRLAGEGNCYVLSGLLYWHCAAFLIHSVPFYAGIPGISTSLLEEFGARLVTHDLPGFVESDPHPGRNLNSSALDMLHLADALGVVDKFWVVGYSGGGMHAWSALRYIPDRVAGTLPWMLCYVLLEYSVHSPVAWLWNQMTKLSKHPLNLS